MQTIFFEGVEVGVGGIEVQHQTISNIKQTHNFFLHTNRNPWRNWTFIQLLHGNDERNVHRQPKNHKNFFTHKHIQRIMRLKEKFSLSIRYLRIISKMNFDQMVWIFRIMFFWSVIWLIFFLLFLIVACKIWERNLFVNFLSWKFDFFRKKKKKKSWDVFNHLKEEREKNLIIFFLGGREKKEVARSKYFFFLELLLFDDERQPFIIHRRKRTAEEKYEEKEKSI